MSGRNRWRETPVAASTGRTCSAGRRLPDCSHFQTAGCPTLQMRPRADCPPATDIARSKASKGDNSLSMAASYSNWNCNVKGKTMVAHYSQWNSVVQ